MNPENQPAPTPETDANTWETIAGAFKCTGANGDLAGMGGYVPADFARKLERERDQLRKVADELAYALGRCDGRCNSMGHSPDLYHESSDACPAEAIYNAANAAYNELPHVPFP